MNAASPIGAALFVRLRGSARLRLLDAVYGHRAVSFRRPSLESRRAPAILEWSMATTGTCDCNTSHYFLWLPRDHRWAPVDFDGWRSQVERQLPPDVRTGDAPWPDLATMTLRSPLWRYEDPHVGPTGGEFLARFRIAGNRFVVTSLQVAPRLGALDGPPLRRPPEP